MSIRKPLLATALSVAVTVVFVALMTSTGGATPPVNVTPVTLAQGQQVAESGSIGTSHGTDVVVAQNTFAPGGSSGWHSHPGVAVAVVQSGQITLYKEPIGGGECRTHTYSAGQTFFERPGNMQNGVNNGSTDAVLFVTFFKVPHAGSARIDQPDPGDCPA
jgi:quercetin dioxygenase-like cupin family protein